MNRLLALLLIGCGGFDTGPAACRFQGEYMIELHSLTPEVCPSWGQRRHFAGSFALGCSPELGIVGYRGNVACVDDGSDVAFACTGQLHDGTCEYELTVQRE